MAEINYGSAAEDHQSFLVLVKHIGTKLNSRSFTHIWERIRRLRQIKINDQNRTIWVRYRRAYAAASNEMGDFQAHRKVLGLIAVGHCSNHDEFSELFESYKNVKEVYANTIFNSRLIAFGLNPDGSQIVEKNCDVRVDSGVQDRDGTKRLLVSHEEQSTSGNSTVDGPSLSKDSSNISTDSNSSVLGKENVEIEHPLSEPKSVKLPERESSDSNCTIVISNSGKDTVTNSSKKQQVTRSHSGSLSKNNAGAEVVFYPDVENCQDMEERLREFIVSLFYVLESKRLDRSFERPDKLQLLCAPFEKKDFVGIDTDSRSYKKRCQGRLRKHLADLSLQAMIPGDAILHYQTAIDLLKAVHDWLWIGACYEGLCAASVVLSCPHTPALIRRNQSFTSDRGAALNDPKIKAGHMTYANGGVNETKTQPSINVNDIIEKYREAISCYSRLKNAGVIELETSLKACRVLIGQHDEVMRLRITYPHLSPSLMQLETYYCSEVGRLEVTRFQALNAHVHDDAVKGTLHGYYDEERLCLIRKTQAMLNDILKHRSETAGLHHQGRTLFQQYLSRRGQAGDLMSRPDAASVPHQSTPNMRLPLSEPCDMSICSTEQNSLEGNNNDSGIHDISRNSSSITHDSSPGTSCSFSPAVSDLCFSSPDFSSHLYNVAHPSPVTALVTNSSSGQAQSPQINTSTSSQKTDICIGPDMDVDIDNDHFVDVDDSFVMSPESLNTPAVYVDYNSVSPDVAQHDAVNMPFTSPSSSSNTRKCLFSESETVNNINTEDSSTLSGIDTQANDNQRSKVSQRSFKSLNPETTLILNTWYQSHIHYPYPSEATVEELARAGGITKTQVKKWMANKRVRSYNTLSFSGNLHPIKFKYAGKRKRQSECDGDLTKNSNTDEESPGCNISKPLSCEARLSLSSWYDAHIHHPYPSDSEKAELAAQSGISTGQVKSWFANKRSRTNNTKRQVPNYFIKKFPDYKPYIDMISLKRHAPKRYLEASDFLQNVVYINLQMSEEDKIQKYSTLSSLYTQIGFHRKSAFFKRITAMQCVAPQYTRPNWHQCYMLLLQILEPYLISLDSREFPTAILSPSLLNLHPHLSRVGIDRSLNSLTIHSRKLYTVPTTGWPVIQLRVLNELVFSAKKMGNPQLAVRHMSFLLQTVFDYLTDVEKQEAASALETLTARCEGTPQPLALDTGLILPPVPLLKLPVVHLFKPLPMQPHLQPVLLPKKRALTPELIKNSPFIYSPFVHAGLKKTDKSRQDYKWVHGDICEVNIQMSNPMPEELRIMHMALLTAGMEIDIFPSSPSLPAHSAPSLVKLVAIPRGVGDLQLIGYSTHVLGVRSHCKLKDMRQIHETRLTVEIVPSLPLIQVSTSFAKSASFFPELDGANIVTSATAVIYAGQSLECLITINNVGNEVVDWLDISLESKLHKGLSNSVLCWNTENVQSQLPLQQHGVACFMVCINGISDFLSTVDHDLTFETEPQTAMPSVVSMWGPRRPRASTINSADDSPTDVVSLESLLFIHYSGGSGLKAGYCRDSAIGFSIEILPSLSFWKWHVLPDRNCSKCHLVFDVRNDSGHQLDLQYSSSHSLILEPGQIRRFSVQIDRLTLPDECRCKKKLRNNLCASPNSEHSTTNSISQILAASVDIRWSIPSVKAKGKSSIEYLEWSEAHLKLIQKSPVNCDYCINGDVYDSATPFLVSYCDIVDLSVQLEFSSDTDGVPDGVYLLSVRAYQDSCDGDRDYNMADKVSVLAASSLVIHKEKTSSLTSHSLSCTFMFYVCGLYKLDITLRSSDNSQSESRDAEHLQQLITGHSIWRCDIPPVIRVSSPEGDPGWTSQTVKNDVESDDDDNNNIDDPGWTSQTVKDDVESDDDDNNNIDDG